MSDNRPRLSCALLLKEADRHLPGWLAWHLSLGIAHIAVIDAGSYDDARQIIQACQNDQPISWQPVDLPESLPDRARRLEMTRRALEHLRDVTSTMDPAMEGEENDDSPLPAEDWIIILDADEYLCPDGTLTTLLNTADDNSAAMALYWRIHGSAGHFHAPQGHVITNHPWHADPDFPDHRFVRLAARLDYLPDSTELADPFTLDLPPEWILRADGQPWQPDAGETSSPPWTGGCIQHYICAQAHGEEELPPVMRNYYDRNEQMTPPPQDGLVAMRIVAGKMQEHALLAGFTRIRNLARQQLADKFKQKQDAESNLPADHVRHETFTYKRIRPPFQASLLTNPQYTPRYVIGRSVVLRSLEGRILSSEHPENQCPFIGFWQETTPYLITLFPRQEGPAMLGDAPAPFGAISLRITPSSHRQTIFLPHETGKGNIPLELLPATKPFPTLLAPLPPADEAEGLSVHGLLMWVLGHPELKPQDLQRALLLLSPDATRHMRMLTPTLREFLHHPINNPVFSPR